ncbi:hypothetical protein A2U01_0098899, partial [Trifolium medium]|nr:hypothetical protein [Trifolium medium]
SKDGSSSRDLPFYLRVGERGTP